MGESEFFESSSDGLSDSIDVSESKLANKSMRIQQLISDYEYRLRGYVWADNGEKFVYVGKPLMGADSIQKVMVLLHPFSSEVILISNKKNFQWQKQVLRTRLDLRSLLVLSDDVFFSNFSDVWRSFTNLIFNIGDIILDKNSQGVITDYISGRKEEKVTPVGGV